MRFSRNLIQKEHIYPFSMRYWRDLMRSRGNLIQKAYLPFFDEILNKISWDHVEISSKKDTFTLFRWATDEISWDFDIFTLFRWDIDEISWDFVKISSKKVFSISTKSHPEKILIFLTWYFIQKRYFWPSHTTAQFSSKIGVALSTPVTQCSC